MGLTFANPRPGGFTGVTDYSRTQLGTSRGMRKSGQSLAGIPLRGRPQPLLKPGMANPQPLDSDSGGGYDTSRQNLRTTMMNSFEPPADYGGKRRSVNDLGFFGGQAGAVNAKLAQLLDPKYANVSKDDADIRGSIAAHDNEMQKYARMARSQAAERAAAEGTLESGNMAGTVQQIMEQARENYGLNDPLPVQYLNWLGNVVRGDFGRSC